MSMSTPPPQDTPHKALIRNINKIKSRIEFNQNEYRDNIGALFFLNLCKAGQEHAADFFVRYSVEGYDIELNEVEKKALEDAGGTTNMVSRIMDVSVGKNVKNNLMNRRRFMYMTATGLGTAGLIGLRIAAHTEEADAVKEESKQEIQKMVGADAKRIIDGARDSDGNIDSDKLAQAMVKYRKDAVDFSGSVKSFLIGTGVVLAVGAFMAVYLTEAWAESRKKSKEIIEDLDLFCKHKLNRREVPNYGGTPQEDGESKPHSNAWWRRHQQREQSRKTGLDKF